MAHSRDVNINSKGNEELKGLIEDEHDTRETLAGLLPIEQTDTTTNSLTYDCTQPSYHGEKFDTFLSHSGQQKIFVRQLYKDLTNQGVSCFFDQDPLSLPLAEHFPSRIFEAANTCKVAVLLLSKAFLESKWPMLELSAFVEARKTTNPNLKILPLFYNIPPDALKQITVDNEKWIEFEKSKEKRDELHRGLRVVRGVNGLKFNEGDDEVKFREEIVKGIWHLLPMPSPRYHVLSMRGQERMCQELAIFFSNVSPNKKRIRIAGLYGIAGQGKSTLAKAFCNFKLGEFEGRVCHLEFSEGNPIRNIKLALQNLTHRPDSYVQSLTSLDQAKLELERRVQHQRVLLVLDNITEECIDEVLYYLRAELGENSWVLLSARSADLLVQHFNVDSKSCMRVPRLEEEEAISILLERPFPGESMFGMQDRGFALKCAKRCLFRDTSSTDIGPTALSFHPLALKAVCSYLMSKYGSNLSKWVAEMVYGSGDGLDEVFAVLGKAFDDMDATYQTIFILLAVYSLSNVSPRKVTEWIAISCNQEIEHIEKAVKVLEKKGFIESFEAEIRIHDLYIEFAQNIAKRMDRWLWWKGDRRSTRQLISKSEKGFECAKLEKCMFRSPSQIAPTSLQILCVLQLVGVQNMVSLDLGVMKSLRSMTLHNCKRLVALVGMEKLQYLAWLQISDVSHMIQLPHLSSLVALQYLEIDIAESRVVNEVGDLTPCLFLREIIVRCPSLLEFPRVNGLSYLEKVEFSLCDKVKSPLDCTHCVELQSIVLTLCSQMAASPLLAGCKKLSKIVLSDCDVVTACPEIHEPGALNTLDLQISFETASAPKTLGSCYGLEYLRLWNMGELMELPSFERLSNLTVLKLGKCGIREPPDLTGCKRLQDVYFFSLLYLKRFPNFSLLRELKKLSLCDCIRVEDPPDIGGCHELQVFHLLYNDNMKGVSKMDKCAQLEEIQVSWRSVDEVTYKGFDPDRCEVNEELGDCLEYWKDEKFGKIGNVGMPEELKELECVKGKTILVRRYIRGVRLYYSLTSPYQWFERKIARYRHQCFSGKRKGCQYQCFESRIAKQTRIRLRVMEGKIMAFPTTAGNFQDPDWLDKVRGYFAEREVIVHGGAASVYSDFCLDVPPMQGEVRMCQELAEFFETVRPDAKGIRTAGLYGMPALGKTTLATAFCIHYSNWFHGPVIYVDLSCRNYSYLFQLPMPHLESITDLDAAYIFYTFMKGRQRALLVLDNITSDDHNFYLSWTDKSGENFTGDKHIHNYYLRWTDKLGENSRILLCTRSLDLLKRDLKMDSQFCMEVPRLKSEEAIAILMERAVTVDQSGLAGGSMDSALMSCAKKCSVEVGRGIFAFHPLALKVLGRHLFHKHLNHFSNWAAEMDEIADGAGDGSNVVFGVLDKVWESMEDKCRTIFSLLVRNIRSVEPTESTFERLSRSCNEEIAQIKNAVEDLHERAFIEEIQPEIRIHELFREFQIYQLLCNEESTQIKKAVS